MNIHEVKKSGAQGDVIFIRVDKLPDGVKESDSNIVAHSETGHHHTAEGAVLYEYTDPLVCYLQMEGESVDVVHRREWDTHDTLRLVGEPGAVWEVHRQREMGPDGWQRVQD